MTHPGLSLVTSVDDDKNRRGRISEHLRGLLGDIDPEVLADVADRVKWVHVPSGEALFSEGDAPHGAYVVAIGRLRVSVKSDGGDRVIDEVGPGGYVGEMALLNRQPRSATVYAARDTELVWLSNEAFDYLVERYPRILLGTSRVLVDRLQRQMRGAPIAKQGARTFAIVPCDRSVDVGWFATELARCLGGDGKVARISAARVDAELGGISRAARGDAGHRRLSSWLMSQERTHEFVVYEGDGPWSEWTDRATRHADHVLFVADGDGSPDLGESERALAGQGTDRGRTFLPTTSLVLLHRERRHAYPGTRRWLERRKVSSHHHVRGGCTSDVARVARILTGRAVGVVFGGGARGYAHIGVLRALEELGIPVDAAGGSSIGAVIAMAKGLELDAAEILALVPPLMRSAFFDPTLPVAALMRGEHTLQGLRRTVGEIEMEDFVLPIFAVSTNLTRGDVVVHRTGSAAVAIRASGSVPGIFPPVPWNGDLLVDGGLSNNVPVDVMAALYAKRIVAVDVIPDVDLRAEGDLPSSVSGFRVAWQMLNPFRQRFAMPSILSTLMRSATTSSRGLRADGVAKLPHLLYLKPALRRWNMVDFSLPEPVEREGYESAIGPIAAWWKSERAEVNDVVQ